MQRISTILIRCILIAGKNSFYLFSQYPGVLHDNCAQLVNLKGLRGNQLSVTLYLPLCQLNQPLYLSTPRSGSAHSLMAITSTVP